VVSTPRRPFVFVKAPSVRCPFPGDLLAVFRAYDDGPQPIASAWRHYLFASAPIPMSDKSYLKDLILLRNDPSKVPLIRGLALKGEMDAQYAMGLIYAEGRGVEVDLAQAHYWLSLAVAQGDRDALLLGNLIGSRMTEEEHQAADRLRRGPNLSAVRAD
jgi:hypothetical protein